MLILLLWQAQPQEAWVLWAFSEQAVCRLVLWMMTLLLRCLLCWVWIPENRQFWSNNTSFLSMPECLSINQARTETWRLCISMQSSKVKSFFFFFFYSLEEHFKQMWHRRDLWPWKDFNPVTLCFVVMIPWLNSDWICSSCWGLALGRIMPK